jgi:hypothetical protein
MALKAKEDLVTKISFELNGTRLLAKLSRLNTYISKFHKLTRIQEQRESLFSFL